MEDLSVNQEEISAEVEKVQEESKQVKEVGGGNTEKVKKGVLDEIIKNQKADVK